MRARCDAPSWAAGFRSPLLELPIAGSPSCTPSRKRHRSAYATSLGL